MPCGDWVFWLGKEYLNLFTPWLKALYNCHNWPSRWFLTLIMRILHLIQTIQPDPQILTSVHKGDSFSPKKRNNKKNSWTKPISFSTDWWSNIWSSRPVLTNKKCPESNIESQLGLNSLRPLLHVPYFWSFQSWTDTTSSMYMKQCVKNVWKMSYFHTFFTCFSHTFHMHFTHIFHMHVKFCIVKYVWKGCEAMSSLSHRFSHALHMGFHTGFHM